MWRYQKNSHITTGTGGVHKEAGVSKQRTSGPLLLPTRENKERLEPLQGTLDLLILPTLISCQLPTTRNIPLQPITKG
jgi:hypothetical protein